MAWTRFWDMHSGGGSKEKWGHIYIEAPKPLAEKIFIERFGHNPDRVSCQCCGEDYAVDEYETLEQASGHERGCKWDEIDGKWQYIEEWCGHDWEPYRTLEDYCHQDANALIIPASQISSKEKSYVIQLPYAGYEDYDDHPDPDYSDDEWGNDE